MKKNCQITLASFILLGAPLVSRAQVLNDVSHQGSASSDRGPSAQPSPAGAFGTKDRQLNVVCKGDQLTISSSNSSLSAILAEVGKCSGAKIEDLEVASQSRFFETIGPGPIREVLTSLLDDAGLNYVIQSLDSNAGKVQTVLLLARAEHNLGEAPEDPTHGSGRRSFVSKTRQEPEEPEPGPDNTPTASETAAPNEPTPAPALTGGATPPAASTAPADSAPMPQPTSLRDRITEMQKLFEQRRQMVKDQSTREP